MYTCRSAFCDEAAVANRFFFLFARFAHEKVIGLAFRIVRTIIPKVLFYLQMTGLYRLIKE